MQETVDVQYTISGPAMCAGVGIHSGAHVRMALRPAPAGTGIVFVRVDLGRDGRIPALATHVATTRLGTTLRNEAGAEVATVEHLLAACAGLEIDNLIIELEGPEIPILDGSSAQFVSLLQKAGRRAQQAPRRRIEILEPVEVSAGDKWARLEPAAEPAFDVTIRYKDGPIGDQRRVYRPSRAAFLADIAEARTYGFLRDVERLHAAGLGRGASLDNTIVIDEGKVLNEEGLRFDDEFVRHKILDAIGDLSLVGAPILGRYVADQPGHELNVKLGQALLAAPDAWRWNEMQAAETLAAVG